MMCSVQMVSVGWRVRVLGVQWSGVRCVSPLIKCRCGALYCTLKTCILMYHMYPDVWGV